MNTAPHFPYWIFILGIAIGFAVGILYTELVIHRDALLYKRRWTD